MVSVAVSKPGKMDLVFMQPGARINHVYYSERTRTRFTAGNSPYLKQRLCVRAGWSAMHAIHHTVAYLHSNVPEFIEPENWPPNSTDLNLADYSVWTAL